MPNGGPPEEVGFRKDCLDWVQERRKFELAKRKFEDASAVYKTAQTSLSNAELTVKSNFDPNVAERRAVGVGNETIVVEMVNGRFSIEVVDTE